jgi:exonuclease III
MPERPEAQREQENPNSIRILQINLNKSEKAHLDIINERVSVNYDIILIQEPYTTTFNAVRTPTNFRPIFPIHRLLSQEKIRSVIWVNKKINTNNWKSLNIHGTNDITAIQLKGPYGTLSIFNIYNDCTHSRNETALRRYIQDHANTLLASENHHMLLAGDFNRHHPLWDRDEDDHLFTQQATRLAEGVIDLIATYDLSMPLPKGIPTLQHMVTGRYSRPDNVFSSTDLLNHITKCEVDPSLRPPSTDHFPIITNIYLPQERTESPPTYNFREVDWDTFREKLKSKLDMTPNPQTITSPERLAATTESLTQAIQDTIKEKVTKSKPRPDAKRWWNGDLRKMRKELNRIRADLYKKPCYR